MNRVRVGWSVFLWGLSSPGAWAASLVTESQGLEGPFVQYAAEQLPPCNGLDMLLGSLARPCIRYNERYYYNGHYRGIEEKPRHLKPKRSPAPPKLEGPIAPSYKEPHRSTTPAENYGINAKPDGVDRAGQESTGTRPGESGVLQSSGPASAQTPIQETPHEEIHRDHVESAAAPKDESPRNENKSPAKERETSAPPTHGLFWALLLLAIAAVGSLKANFFKEKLALLLEKRNLIIRKERDKRKARDEKEDRLIDRRDARDADASGEGMRRNESRKKEQQQRTETNRREDEKRRQEQQQRQSGGGSDGPMTVDDAFAYFGLAKGCTELEFQAVYREKIRNNHPDQHAKVDPDIFQMIEARAKHINQAAQLIRKYHGWK